MPGTPLLPPEAALGARLKAVRDHYGLNIDALARLTKATDGRDQTGVSASALRRYEAYEALPTAREIRVLCDSLGLTANWLIFGYTSTQRLTAAEENIVIALRALHADIAFRSATGGGIRADPNRDEEKRRLERIEQAKRR